MEDSIGDQRTLLGGRAGAAEVSVGGADTLPREGAPLGRIDQFELVRELGGGGFGVVYLARDTVAGIEVAVKGLPPLVKNNADELERIRENFALVSRLHHPNIAAALHLHPAQAVSYAQEGVRQALRVLPGDTLMVMAFAPGVTLSRWRKQFPEGRVPVPQALEVCRQVAAALDYAHGERVVHRDVKPSNVMVETRGKDEGRRMKAESGAASSFIPHPSALNVRVLDFGLAAEIRSSLSRVSQEKGDTSGTRPYMAPEQWAGRRQDGRTDQYALAALFHELVSGAVPFASAFDTGDPVIMERAVVGRAPEPLAGLTKAQNAALLRGLAKGPAERFATCGEFVGALGGALAKTPRRKGGKALALAVAVAAAAVLCFGAYRSYTSYRSYSARREAERAAAERTQALDAAQRERLEGLRAAAEAALAAGDLETAGARIAELKGAGGPTSVSADLQKKYEAKAGERETNKRYAAASVAREAAQRLERGQGFGARLDALEVTWREAEAARQGGGWGQALSGYDAVLAACKALGTEEVSREDAKARRGEAEKALSAADQAGSASDAADLFAAGGRASSRAAEAFEKGAFAEATKAWREAAATYASAKARALAAQGYAQAKAAFESELAKSEPTAGGRASPRADLLDAHGGVKWSEVKRLRTLGAASANDPAAGEKAYRDALAALPGAVGEAQAAERAAKLAAALAAARQAKAAGQWQACIDKAGEALALEAGNAEAAALKREAELELKPKGPVEGQPWASPATGMEFVWVPALKVWVGKYEVTNGEYRKKEPGHDSKEFNGHSLNGERQPAVYVNFDDAKAYAAWLTERERDGLGGLRYRVISEKEWETVARCGDGREYPWGDAMPPKYGNYSDSAAKRDLSFNGIDGYTDGFAVTCPVERSGANEWGLYGIGGNVWECCASDTSGGSFGAWRGASWGSHSPGILRVAYRFGHVGSVRDGNNGFRLALSR